MKKIGIVSSGYFPIPPVRGGAIETLINMIIDENNERGDVDLVVYSMYAFEAREITKTYKHAQVSFIMIPIYVRILDRLLYFFFKNIIKKQKHMSYRYILQRLYYIDKVSKDIALQEYDSIVVQNHPTLLNVLKKNGNKKRYDGKYYYHAHNEIRNTFGNDTLLKGCKKFICVSHYIEKSIALRLNINCAEQFAVVRNRVDEKKFRNIDESKVKTFLQKYHIPSGFMLYTYTGRLNPEKGVKELLNAYKRAKPANSKLIIAGSYYFGSNLTSSYEKELECIAKDIEKDIVFTGNIDYCDMPLLYHVSDVIVLPSVWNDPAPLTVIESLTSGKPLITTDTGGIPEYANTHNSIICKADDTLVDQLANAIRRLSEDGELRKELVKNAIKESDCWTRKSYYEDFITTIK